MRKFNTLKEQLSVTEEPNMRSNQVTKLDLDPIEIMRPHSNNYGLSSQVCNLKFI